MNIQIFNNENFGEIRGIMIDGNPYFVAADVCKALELTNVTMTMERLKENEKAKFNLGLSGGATNCINEPGIYRLIFASRKPEAEKFQDWVYHEVLPAIRKTGGYSINGTFAKVIVDIGETAKQIQNLFAVKNGIALAQAIDFVGVNGNYNVESLKKLLPPAEHNTGYLNPTQLGEKLGGLPAKVVNAMLAQEDLQYKDGKDWRLTESGKVYGEEMPYTRNNHSGYQIRWNKDVLEVLSV